MMKKALSENLPDTEATKRRIAGLTPDISTEAAMDGGDTLVRGNTRSRFSVVGKIAACFALCAVIGGAAILPGLLEQDAPKTGSSMSAVTSAPVQTDAPALTTTVADSSAENVLFEDSDGHVKVQIDWFYRDESFIVADLLYQSLDASGSAFLQQFQKECEEYGKHADVIPRCTDGKAAYCGGYKLGYQADGSVRQRISVVYNGTLDPTATLRYQMTDEMRTHEVSLPEVDPASVKIALTGKTEYPVDEVVISDYSVRFLTSQALLQQLAGMTDEEQRNYLLTQPKMQELQSLKLVYADGTEHFVAGNIDQEADRTKACQGSFSYVAFAVTEEKPIAYKEYACYSGPLDGALLHPADVVGIKINDVYYAK